MSSPFAFAAVTAVIRQLLVEGLALDKVGDAVGTITVSAAPPDQVVKAGQADPTQVNIYLHQVSHNPAFRNKGLPARDSRGELRSAPPLAVNLHYLVSTFSANMYVAEALLGHTMRILHEAQVITREAVRRALVPSPVTALGTALQAAGLADQIELIKLSPTAVALEDMSRIWSAFQAHYRTTVAYEASVVFVDPHTLARPALPATSRAVFGEVLALPEIERIGDAGVPVTTEDTLVVTGRRLLGASGTILRIGDADIVPPSTSTASEISIDLTTAPRPRAGVLGVVLIHTRGMGEPLVQHEGVSSAVAALILRPAITGTSVANGATWTVDGVAYSDGVLTLDFGREVGRDQKLEVLLNEDNAPASRSRRGYLLTSRPGHGLPEGSKEFGTISVSYTNLARGDYLVRARIDGAESLLAAGGDGRFATPLVTL